MRSPKHYLKITFLLLLYIWLFLFLFGGLCYAEETYKITATELNQLDQELILQRNLLNRLEQSNKLQSKELIKLSTELKLSKEALVKQGVLLTNTEQALNEANESLTRYAKEVKAKELRLKRQRTFAYILCGGLVYLLIAK